jgi:adenylate kinase
MKKLKVFCVIGKSGSGKGTQVGLLKKKLGKTLHIVNGDLFRAFIKSSHPFAARIGKIVNSGGLPPAWFSAYLWEGELIRFTDAKVKTAIFEGTPRRVWEAELLADISQFMFNSKPIAIYLDISDKEARKRLLKRLVCKKCKQLVPYKLLDKNPKKCGFCGGPIIRRKDDDEDSIKKRLSWYRTEVWETIKYYKKQKCLVYVNGEQDVPDVFSELWSKLKKKL